MAEERLITIGEYGYRRVSLTDVPQRDELIQLPGDQNPFLVYPIFGENGILNIQKTRIFRGLYDGDSVPREVVFGKAHIVWDHIELLKSRRVH